MLQVLCEQHGLEVIKILTVNDDYEATVAAIKAAQALTDIVIMSGGVSVGDYDYVNKALRAVGFTIHFDKVAIKPGRPTTFASLDDKLVFGLPGNPVAVFLTFYLFVLRAVQKIYKQSSAPEYFLPLAADFTRKSSDRLEFVPCDILSDGTLIPLEFHGSAHLAALLSCKGFFIVNQGIDKILQGESVEFMQT